MSALIFLLIYVLVACVLYWALVRIMATFEVPEKIQSVVQIFIVVIAVLFLASYVLTHWSSGFKL